MKKLNRIIFLACGLLLTLAATSVFAQEANIVQLNQRPLVEFAQSLKEKVENKQVDLTKPFSVKLEGILNKDGKLDPKISKYTESKGDEAMIDTGKSFIETLNSSGLFVYLAQMGIENIKLNLGQDDNRAYSIISSELPNAQKAKSIAGGMNALIQIAGIVSKNENERILIKSAKIENTDKVIAIKMDLEKSVAQEMISRKLKESQVKQPNGK